MDTSGVFLNDASIQRLPDINLKYKTGHNSPKAAINEYDSDASMVRNTRRSIVGKFMVFIGLWSFIYVLWIDQSTLSTSRKMIKQGSMNLSTDISTKIMLKSNLVPLQNRDDSKSEVNLVSNDEIKSLLYKNCDTQSYETLDEMEKVIHQGFKAFSVNNQIQKTTDQDLKLFKSAVARMKFTQSENFGNYLHQNM